MTASDPALIHPEERVVSLSDWIGFFGMVIGMFMAILDIQIVASSLSEIQAGLGASNDEISWVQTSYLIAEVIMIPLSGWMARVFSTRWLYLTSCISFTLASLACAAAWNLESMIIFRALQGFLGGAMIPTVFATTFMLFPPRHQTAVSMMIGLTATMAPTLGPTLGGYLTQAVSWHWLFLINLFPGLLVCFLVFFFVRADRPKLELLRNLDWQGILSVAVFLGTLQYVLEEGSRKDWFADATIRTLAAISALGAITFLWRELTARFPVIDLRAFCHRNFSIGCVFSFLLGICLYGGVYIYPLYLGRVRGYDSLEIGIVMMVTGLFQLLSAPIAGNVARHLDPRITLSIGFSLLAASFFVASPLTSQWGYRELFLPQALRGFALMFCMIPTNIIALGSLPPQQVQNASGLFNLMRNLGGAIGLAVLNTQITERTVLHTQRLGEHLTTANATVVQTLDGLTERLTPVLGEASELASLKIIQRLLQREAMTLTFSDMFWLLGIVSISAFLLIPFAKKNPPPQKESAALSDEKVTKK